MEVTEEEPKEVPAGILEEAVGYTRPEDEPPSLEDIMAAQTQFEALRGERIDLFYRTATACMEACLDLRLLKEQEYRSETIGVEDMMPHGDASFFPEFYKKSMRVRSLYENAELRPKDGPSPFCDSLVDVVNYCSFWLASIYLRGRWNDVVPAPGVRASEPVQSYPCSCPMCGNEGEFRREHGRWFMGCTFCGHDKGFRSPAKLVDWIVEVTAIKHRARKAAPVLRVRHRGIPALAPVPGAPELAKPSVDEALSKFMNTLPKPEMSVDEAVACLKVAAAGEGEAAVEARAVLAKLSGAAQPGEKLGAIIIPELDHAAITTGKVTGMTTDEPPPPPQEDESKLACPGCAGTLTLVSMGKGKIQCSCNGRCGVRNRIFTAEQFKQWYEQTAAFMKHMSTEGEEPPPNVLTPA
jgi:hypothetical protein